MKSAWLAVAALIAGVMALSLAASEATGHDRNVAAMNVSNRPSHGLLVSGVGCD